MSDDSRAAWDDIAAAADVQDHWDRPLVMHADDVFLVSAMREHQAAFALPQSRPPRIDPSLADGRLLPLGAANLTVTTIPGHSPGQVMFTWPGHAIVGDAIFAGSVGRTDLPGGDFAALVRSIRERIYRLPEQTILHPGHGPDTTVVRERAANPYVAAG